MGLIKQGFLVKNSLIVIEHLINLFINGFLRLGRIQARNPGEESDIVIYKSLSGHGELFSKRF